MTWRIEVVETSAGFSALEMPWNDLTGAVPDASFMQSFSWCYLTWSHLAPGKPVRLRCATMWDGEALVAVWPCIGRRVMGLNHLSQLGFGIGDYARPLIRPDFDTPEVCRALVKSLAAGFDAFDVVCLDLSPAMVAVLSALPAARRLVNFDDYWIDPHKRGSWNAFMASLSKNMRNHLISSRKKLMELGQVTFSIARTHEEQARIVDWTLTQKQAWLTRHGLRNDWYSAVETRDFLIKAARAVDAAGHMAIFTLQLDGIPLASWFGAINRDRVGALMITFDAEYQRFSPGMLLIQDVVHWSYNCNRVADLGGDEAEFKARWATDRVTRLVYCYGLTPRGILYQAWVWFREFLSPRLKAYLPSGFVARVLRAIKGAGARAEEDASGGGLVHE